MRRHFQNLSEAVAAIHGCECAHSGTSLVVEFYEGEKVFEGEIETFTLTDHPQASEAFAWAFAEDDGEVQYIALLKLPPINEPSDAVRAAIASGKF